MDGRTEGLPGRTDKNLGAVEAIDRADDASRKKGIEQERRQLLTSGTAARDGEDESGIGQLHQRLFNGIEAA